MTYIIISVLTLLLTATSPGVAGGITPTPEPTNPILGQTGDHTPTLTPDPSIEAIPASEAAGVTQPPDAQVGLPPEPFNKSSPSFNNPINVPLHTIFSWDPSSRVDYYEYCYYKIGNNTCLDDKNWHKVHDFIASADLDPGQQYYWQVRAVNSFGTTYAGFDPPGWYSFTTGYPPDDFNKTSPLNDSEQLSSPIQLNWGPAQKTDNYFYCIDTSNNNNCNGTWVDTLTSTDVYLSGLLVGRTYYWQVKAHNMIGDTLANGGVWWKFSTFGFLNLLPLLRR